MFQFPAFAPDGLCIQPPVTPSACTVAPGCPIRRSQDQSSFDSSPGLIAAYRVLHRLITPRHPPCTLSSLITFVAGPKEPTTNTLKPPQRLRFGEPRQITISMRLSKSRSQRSQNRPNRPAAKITPLEPTAPDPEARLISISVQSHPINYFSTNKTKFPGIPAQAFPPIVRPHQNGAYSRSQASTRPCQRHAGSVRLRFGATGDERSRTADLLVANQTLSQLSYVPESIADFGLRIADFQFRISTTGAPVQILKSAIHN